MKILMEHGTTLKGTVDGIVYYGGPNGRVLARSESRPREENLADEKEVLRRQIARTRRQWSKLSASQRACWNAYAHALSPTRLDGSVALQEGLWLYAAANVMRSGLGLPAVKDVPDTPSSTQPSVTIG